MSSVDAKQVFPHQLADTGTIDKVRDRHAGYFADQSVKHWELWEGPDQLVALDWVDAELANLRVEFRWAADGEDLTCASAIAAHTAILAFLLQRYEPVGWVEELLDAATRADLRRLPRLFTSATGCMFTRRPDAAVVYDSVRYRFGPSL